MSQPRPRRDQQGQPRAPDKNVQQQAKTGQKENHDGETGIKRDNPQKRAERFSK
jgi:hypothetical protein